MFNGEIVKANKKILTDFIDEMKISNIEFSRVIEKITLRPCSERTVRAWLLSSDAPSSRACPDWVIGLLPEIKKEITK